MVGGGGVGVTGCESTETAHSLNRRCSGFTGVSHFTCDLRWAAGAEELTVNMHAVHDFTVVMSELFIA